MMAVFRNILKRPAAESTNNRKIFASIGFGMYVESMHRAWISDEKEGSHDVALKEGMEVIVQLGLLDKTNFNKCFIQDTFAITKEGSTKYTTSQKGLMY